MRTNHQKIITTKLSLPHTYVYIAHVNNHTHMHTCRGGGRRGRIREHTYGVNHVPPLTRSHTRTHSVTQSFVPLYLHCFNYSTSNATAHCNSTLHTPHFLAIRAGGVSGRLSHVVWEGVFLVGVFVCPPSTSNTNSNIKASNNNDMILTKI